MHTEDAMGPEPQVHDPRTPAVPPDDPPTLSDEIRPLRRWGARHPFVLELMASLPHQRETVETTEALAWEAASVPGIRIDAQRRVSVLRLRSLGPAGQRLVGQIQALVQQDHPLATPQLALYVHEPHHGATTRVEDPDAWFTRVLEAHYTHTGPGTPVDHDTGAAATV